MDMETNLGTLTWETPTSPEAEVRRHAPPNKIGRHILDRSPCSGVVDIVNEAEDLPAHRGRNPGTGLTLTEVTPKPCAALERNEGHLICRLPIDSISVFSDVWAAVN